MIEHIVRNTGSASIFPVENKGYALSLSLGLVIQRVHLQIPGLENSSRLRCFSCRGAFIRPALPNRRERIKKTRFARLIPRTSRLHLGLWSIIPSNLLGRSNNLKSFFFANVWSVSRNSECIALVLSNPYDAYAFQIHG